MTQHSPANWEKIVAASMAVLIIALVAFLVIRNKPFADPNLVIVFRIVLGIAIAILGATIPGFLNVSWQGRGLLIRAGGALALFVFSYIWSPSVIPSPSFYSFTGRVAYKNKSQLDKDLKPVEGAEVEIKNTGLKSKTGAGGSFTIAQIPSQITVKELVISRGSHFYLVDVKEYPDGIYPIPEESGITKSAIYAISSSEWNENKANGCQPIDKNKYFSVMQFSLYKIVRRDSDFSDLILRVWCQQDAEIISARKLEPQYGEKVKDDLGYSKAQKWLIPITHEETTIRLSVCLGVVKKGSPLSRANLQGSYWFEKVE